MHLQSRDGPHLRDAAFDAVFKGSCLIVSVDDEQDAASVHNGADAYGKSRLGYEVDIVVEETRVGDDGVVCQRLHTCARSQRRARLVEGDVSVGTYAAQEEVDTAVGCDFFFVATALGYGVFGVAVEDIDVLGEDVNLVEKVGPHEGVVALLVVARYAAVFVHIEGDDIAERHFAFLVQVDESAVHAQGAAACRASEHKGVFGCRFGLIDAGGYVVGCPLGYVVVILFDDKSHG